AKGPGRARGPESRSPSGDRLWDGLREGHRLLRAELREVLRAEGVFLAEYRALGRLGRRERTRGELAEELGLAPASMTDLARQLTARGWVRRRYDPSDRRAQLLSATRAGLRVHRAGRAGYRRRLGEVAALLSPAGRSALARGLEELTAVLAERRRTAEPPAG
ncbi:MAG: MarR family winged helix-turn-helix transcriptional regulator, partial [Thermoplasmata archaeon]